jgi:hypothetical protein
MTTAPEAKRLLADLKIKVRNAWLVLARLPDVDARFRAGLRGAWCLPVVRGWQAYDPDNLTPVRPPVPSPHEITEAEGIMTWMVWLRQTEGKPAVNRIIAWAMGAPWCNMSAREGCSDKTVKNRIDRSMALILREFRDTMVSIPVVDEPALSNRRARYFAAKLGEASEGGAEVMAGKVFIGGFGFRFHGKSYESAQLR